MENKLNILCQTHLQHQNKPFLCIYALLVLQAWQFLQKCFQQLLALSVMSFNAAISLWEKGMLWEEACGSLLSLLRRHLNSDVVSHNAAISALEMVLQPTKRSNCW